MARITEIPVVLHESEANESQRGTACSATCGGIRTAFCYQDACLPDRFNAMITDTLLCYKTPGIVRVGCFDDAKDCKLQRGAPAG